MLLLIELYCLVIRQEWFEIFQQHASTLLNMMVSQQRMHQEKIHKDASRKD